MKYNINTKFNMPVCIIGNASSGKTTLGNYLNSILDDAILIENCYSENYFNYLEKTLNEHYKYFIIDDLFTYVTVSERKVLYDFAKKHNKIIINLSTDSKDLLLFPYTIVINNHEVIMEGLSKDVLKEEKIFTNIGIKLPFAFQLSKELKDYGVISKYAYSNEELIDLLWN